MEFENPQSLPDRKFEEPYALLTFTEVDDGNAGGSLELSNEFLGDSESAEDYRDALRQMLRELADSF